MKITEIGKQAVVFKNGDFFLNDDGYLRQFISVPGGIAVLDIKTGCLAINTIKPTVAEAAENYVQHNGSITKVTVEEILYKRTTQVLGEQ